MDATTKKVPSVGYAALMMLSFAAFLMIGLLVFGAPLQTVVFLAWLLMNALALPLGYTYRELEKIGLDAVRGSLPPVVIMLSVGALISVYIAAGTVPTIIYYGLKIINVRFFLVTALLLCSIVSLFTGTSWGTMGTVGIALLGVGTRLGIPVGMTAGAIISGSWFGDKLSPLSDTTNFAAAVMGIDVVKHAKHMCYTTIPALIASAVVFLFLGNNVAQTQGVSLDGITEISTALQANFKVGLIPLIPMAVVIVMLLMQRAPAQSILIGVVTAIFIAVFYQGEDAGFVLKAFYSGYNKTFDQPFLTTLLNRGGMTCMNPTIQALIFTTGIGGMIREMGLVKILFTPIAGKIKSTLGLVATSMCISYASVAATGSHMFAAIMVQSTMLDLFKTKGLKPENVSRICEDCGTIGVTLIPYGVTATFIISTLGVSFAEYLPYAVFCFFCPIMSLICGATGFGMARYKEGEAVE